MEQVEAITLARQAIKIAQLEELVEILKAELTPRVQAEAVAKAQAEAEAEDNTVEDVDLEGDFDVDSPKD